MSNLDSVGGGECDSIDINSSCDKLLTAARQNTSSKEPIKPLEISITTLMGLSRSITVYFDKMVRATRGPAPLHQLRTADTEKTVAIVAHGCASQAMASARVVINIHALHMRQCKLISKLRVLHKLSLGLRDQIAQRHPNKIRKCHTPHP